MATNFPTSLDSYTTKNSGDTITEGHINDPQDAIEALEAKVGVNSSAVDTSLDYKVNNFFVENTRKIWFYENTAPTGWTYASSITDQVIAVKGGSEAYNANGGTEEAGSWTISSIAAANESTHTHTGPSHTHTMGTHIHTMGTHLHTTGDVTLSAAQSGLPAHNHQIEARYNTQDGNYTDVQASRQDVGNLAAPGPYTEDVAAAAAASAHNHGNTQTVDPGDTNASDPGDTNASGTAASGAGAAHTHTVTHTAGWRPDAALGIIATFTGA